MSDSYEITKKYKFAEIKYGKIVAIMEHSVPLEEFVKFFNPNALFIDITDVEFDGEVPQIGDAITTGADGYKIVHKKAIYNELDMKAFMVEKMRLIRDSKELEPIDYEINGVVYTFDADADANTRIAKARQLLEDSDINEILWTTFDNNHVVLTLNDFKGINIAQAIRSTQLHNRYNALKNFIYSVAPENISIITDDSFGWDYELPTQTTDSED